MSPYPASVPPAFCFQNSSQCDWMPPRPARSPEQAMRSGFRPFIVFRFCVKLSRQVVVYEACPGGIVSGSA